MREIFLILGDSETETGPMSVHEVLARVEGGHAGAETLYWESGLEDWEPLTSLLPGLAVDAAPTTSVEVATNPQCRVEDGGQIPPDRPRLVRPPSAGSASNTTAPSSSDSALRVAALRASSRKRDRAGSFVVLAWFFALLAAGAACFWFLPMGRIAMAVAGLIGVVLAIMAMAGGRVSGGIVALLAAALLPVGIYTVAKGRDLRPAMFTDIEKARAEKTAAQPGFKDLKLEVAGERRRLSGIVQTVPSGSPEKLQVIVSWLDVDEGVVTTSNVPLAGGEEIPPGTASKFTVDAPADPAIRSYRTEIAPL